MATQKERHPDMYAAAKVVMEKCKKYLSDHSLPNEERQYYFDQDTSTGALRPVPSVDAPIAGQGANRVVGGLAAYVKYLTQCEDYDSVFLAAQVIQYGERTYHPSTPRNEALNNAALFWITAIQLGEAEIADERQRHFASKPRNELMRSAVAAWVRSKGTDRSARWLWDQIREPHAKAHLAGEFALWRDRDVICAAEFGAAHSDGKAIKFEQFRKYVSAAKKLVASRG